MSIKYASLATLQKMQQEIDSRYAEKFTLGLEKLATATSGYAASYKFTMDGTQVGETINIPKDFLVKSATIETCATADSPVAGLAVGDKYIDFVVNSVDNDDTASHIYLPVQDLVDIYTAGNGINVSAGNEISLAIDSTNANGLAVTSAGLKIGVASASATGALSATDFAKFDAAADREVLAATGDGNVVTAVGQDADGNVTVTKGITALQESDLVAITDSEVTGLWS